VWEVTGTPVRRGEEIIGGSVSVRDVTEIRALSAELVRVAGEFESFVGTSTEGHYRIGADGIVLWASPSMAVLTGKPMSEIVGIRARGVVHPDDVAKRDAAMAELLRTHRPQTFEVRGEHADGTWHWFEGTLRALFNEDGSVREFHNTTRDVTEQKLLAAAEREARAVFSAAVDQAPIGMCLVSPEGRFLRVNAALCKLLGRTADELLDLSFQEVTHPDDLAADLALVQEVLSGARDDYEMQKRFLLPDGQTVEAWLLVTLIRHADGAPAHFISQVVDLTQAQAAEARLRVLEDRDRIAGEFHDHVVQRLFGAGLMLQGVEMALGTSPHGDRLSAAVNEIDETIRQIRSAIYDLRTS
jgi:PAS domain S-box-containing protein